MGKTQDFSINRRGLQAFLLGGEMKAAMLAAAQDVAAEAARRTPRRSGELAASYRVEQATVTIPSRKYGSTTRAAGRVTSDSSHAAAAEFGHYTIYGHPIPGKHVLGKMAGARSLRARRRGDA